MVAACLQPHVMSLKSSETQRQYTAAAPTLARFITVFWPTMNARFRVKVMAVVRAVVNWRTVSSMAIARTMVAAVVCPLPSAETAPSMATVAKMARLGLMPGWSMTYLVARTSTVSSMETFPLHVRLQISTLVWPPSTATRTIRISCARRQGISACGTIRRASTRATTRM